MEIPHLQEDTLLQWLLYSSSVASSSQTTRMGGLYILNRTKSYQICDADQIGTDTRFLRKHTKLFPKLKPKITEPTPQHESEIPCIHEDHFFKGKASILKNHGMILPSKKNQWDERRQTSCGFYFMKAGWTNAFLWIDDGFGRGTFFNGNTHGTCVS